VRDATCVDVTRVPIRPDDIVFGKHLTPSR
jgi:hypothetical protein